MKIPALLYVVLLSTNSLLCSLSVTNIDDLQRDVCDLRIQLISNLESDQRVYFFENIDTQKNTPKFSALANMIEIYKKHYGNEKYETDLAKWKSCPLSFTLDIGLLYATLFIKYNNFSKSAEYADETPPSLLDGPTQQPLFTPSSNDSQSNPEDINELEGVQALFDSVEKKPSLRAYPEIPTLNKKTIVGSSVIVALLGYLAYKTWESWDKQASDTQDEQNVNNFEEFPEKAWK